MCCGEFGRAKKIFGYCKSIVCYYANETQWGKLMRGDWEVIRRRIEVCCRDWRFEWREGRYIELFSHRWRCYCIETTEKMSSGFYSNTEILDYTLYDFCHLQCRNLFRTIAYLKVPSHAWSPLIETLAVNIKLQMKYLINLLSKLTGKSNHLLHFPQILQTIQIFIHNLASTQLQNSSKSS
jgi:hypothetical protein